MDTNNVIARIAPAEPVSAPVGLRLREEAPGRATAVATQNGHLLLDYYFREGGRSILVHLSEGARQGRISGTSWSPRGRLWLLDLEPAAA